MSEKNERLAINVTVSEEEYEFVRLHAYLSKCSMSAYVRRLIDRERKLTENKTKPKSQTILK
ncbi:MAG: hypothetical protein DKM50_13165 [Candidatus Margulisiibacteriota bacterium]|nr:MAG: hypothetical protein A2X43_13850 [Candidatus Margulisbacteria bacterium GWD2_39_127]OGI05539.1 MAG: hypothetical protein A2X42_00600 [Candidatus Margulisbacteria bacterium GWF2_38_17]OGI08380.1 MAG: hypothetical protein A2X41_10740 [Candidatus Margulisbacteria bacterium GWE2_39_32]PZM77351.1 MAG: hypothetical protein DKM50_13165 [Candidatus Margulisiibacteriota bacterium]HAR63139.1 hypothetical protein [Candidatus Margulisiibacteriota bacterium]